MPKAKGQGLSWAGHLSGSGDSRAIGRLKGQYLGLDIKTGALAPLVPDWRTRQDHGRKAPSPQAAGLVHGCG